MSFQVTGLDAAPFRRFYGLSDKELQSLGAKRFIAHEKLDFPDRIELTSSGARLCCFSTTSTSRPTHLTKHATPFSSANGPRCHIEP